MPSRVKRPCSHPGCPEMKPCPKHKPAQRWAPHTRTTKERGYAGDHVRWRRVVLLLHPMCGCGAKAVIAHHIIPREDAPKLALEIANGAGMCRDCHERLHGRRA